MQNPSFKHNLLCPASIAAAEWSIGCFASVIIISVVVIIFSLVP